MSAKGRGERGGSEPVARPGRPRVAGRGRRAALLVGWLAAVAVPAAAEAEGGHGGDLFWQISNLALLVAVLIYFARKPVLSFLAGRRDTIARNLESSAALLAEAERRLQEWNERAARLDQDVAAIREATRRAAETERDRILADARVTAERIRRVASVAAERELHQAREALRREAADLAVELAGRILREQVNDDDRRRLIDEFIGRVERGGAH